MGIARLSAFESVGQELFVLPCTDGDHHPTVLRFTAIAHLPCVFGDKTYDPLAGTGETMTTADMVAYAYDQIDQARAALKAVSK